MRLYLIVLGCLAASALSLLAWAIRRGEFHAPEEAKHRLLELDRRTGVKRDE